MGGLFSTPKIQPPPPPPPAAEDPEQAAAAAREERLRVLARRLRGRAGTIATGPRGILRPGPFAPRRRTLLGG